MKLMRYIRNILLVLVFTGIALTDYHKYIILFNGIDIFKITRYLTLISIALSFFINLFADRTLQRKLVIIFIVYPLFYFSMLLLTDLDLPLYHTIYSPDGVHELVIQERTTLASSDFCIYVPHKGCIYKYQDELHGNPGQTFDSSIKVEWNENDVYLEINTKYTVFHDTWIHFD